MVGLAYLALWAFIFCIPWENVLVISGIGTIGRLVGMVAVALTLLAAVVSGKLRRWHALHVAALLFLLWAASGQLVFRSTGTLSNKFWTYTQLVIVLLMVWELAASKRRQIGLLVAYVLGAYVAAFDTIFISRREAGALRRFAAEGFDPNDLAMVLALALPMAWYLGMTYHRPLLRWVFRSYVPIGVVAIGLTGSRGGVLAAIVALLIVPFTMTRLSPQRIAMLAVMIAASGMLAIAYIPDTVVQRLASTGTEVQLGRFGGRGKIWKAGLHAFAEKPILGHGAGTFKPVVAHWLGTNAQVAHNSYLSVMVEQGLIGFLIFAAMFIAVFLALLDLPHLERRFGLVLFATLGTAMLPLTWDDHKVPWFILAALLGFAKAYTADMRGAATQAAERAPVARAAVSSRPRGRWIPIAQRPHREQNP